jgi:hypothetical protein
MELLRLLVPTALRAVLRGGFTPMGVCIFRAGLYVGLGGFGIWTASCVSNGSFGGTLGMPRGPKGREGGPMLPFEVTLEKSVGDGIRTAPFGAWWPCKPPGELFTAVRSRANR